MRCKSRYHQPRGLMQHQHGGEIGTGLMAMTLPSYQKLCQRKESQKTVGTLSNLTLTTNR